MDDAYGPLLFQDELSEEQRAELKERMEADSDLADAWRRWRVVRRRVRRRFQKHLPDRRLLVLYALEKENPAALTDEDRRALDAARSELTGAMETIPALERVVQDIQEAKADFEAEWNQHLGGAAEGTSVGASQSDRRDRSPRPSRASEGRAFQRWTRRLAAAALVAGIALLAVWYGPQDASRTTIAVSEGEQQVVELGGGSTVRLAGGTSLSYPNALDASTDRHLTLEEGRAFFDVASVAEGGSFVVETPTATARVLGTQFSVSAQPGTTEVVLAEGTVQFGAVEGGEVVALEPGERSRVARGRGPTRPASVDLTDALEWTGLFVFRDVPVQRIVERLGRHYEVEISVPPTLADEPVTGTFDRNQPVSQVVNALAATLGAEVRQEDGGYHLHVAP